MKKIFLLFAGMFITLISCDKQSVYTEHYLTNEINLNGHIFKEVDGRLLFDDKNAFEETISQLQKDPELIEVLKSNSFSFKSLNSAFDEISELILQASSETETEIEKLITNCKVGVLVEEQGEFYFEQTIPSEIMGELLNEKGIVQIGDSVYMHTRAYTIQGHINNIKEIESIDINFNNKEKNHFFILHENMISPYLTTEKSEICTCRSQDFKDNDNRTRRLRGGVYDVRLHLYNEIYISTTSLRKNLGIWLQSKVDFLELIAFGTYRDDVFYIEKSFDISMSNTNSQRVSKTIANSINLQLYYELLTLDGYHMLKHEKQTKTCDTHR